jgi:lipopolysaccharide/colanic/teichoic acid biosynthesis glycosyltransferase
MILDTLYRDPLRADERAGVVRRSGGSASHSTVWAIPRDWQTTLPAGPGRRIAYTDAVVADSELLRDVHEHPWFVISDGRFTSQMSGRLLQRGFAGATVDAVAVMVDPKLAAYRERVRLTPQGRLVGYRRLYRDSMEPILMPREWPHHLFVKGEAAGAILEGGVPGEFQAIVERLRSRGLGLTAFAVAGSVVDLATKEGLLSLIEMVLGCASSSRVRRRAAAGRGTASPTGEGEISTRSRFVGQVLLGSRVCVEPDAVIIGPTILCDRSVIRAGAVVDASIVGVESEVARDQVVRNAVVIPRRLPADPCSTRVEAHREPRLSGLRDGAAFRSWPRFSYAASFKRVADVIVAVTVLVLFAPIIPFIALAVKVSSPGPAFFKHRRQGLHGRPFNCVKFRTMRADAHTLQDKLRFISEVDGPQFKMADDPRITTVGRFLRETYLDEIPQFVNVLAGDMSVVGPRPSPESENTLCPWWRDARLSVRPGITGLWQIHRTREPMKDFQEWIHYDTQYARELSWRLDLWVCWQTFRKMGANFLNQF